MNTAAINIPPPPPIGGPRCDAPKGGRASFADIRDRIELDARRSDPRFELREGDGRATRRPAHGAAEPAGAAIEIQLPRESFTATIVDLAPVAGLDGRPASLAPLAPGTPAAAYARAAELLHPGPERGTFVSTTI